MSHLSLYRKFRPSTFEEMVRQEHVVRILGNQIAGKTIGHAYLFCGPRGTGKTTIARIFARAVNCEQPRNGSPCGKCATCIALSEGSLDVTEIDAASNNGVNEMRDLREKVQYPPVVGSYKVYIIDEVHMLTDSAFNALLKTLEEPPRHAVFILATTEPQKIPATILSRCMRLDFKLIPAEDLEAHLKRILKEIGRDYEEAAVAAIARAGAGSDRDMLSIAEMCLAYSEKLTYEGVTAVLGSADFKETGALVRALLCADSGTALELTEKILGEGKAVGVLCRDVLTTLNQVAVAKTCKNAERLLSLPAELYDQVRSIADGAEGRAILRATEIFAKLEPDLRYSASPRISLETAVMRTAIPAAEYDLDALTVRVAALEAKLAAGVPAVAAPIQEVREAREEEKPPVKKTDGAPSESFDFYDDGWTPPEEEPVFAEAYFDEPSPPPEKGGGEEHAPAVVESAKQPAAQVRTEEGTGAAQIPAVTAEMAFGKFMRTLRKTSRNGVLFTMCSDLEAKFEGATLVLYTESDTVLRALGREEHVKLMSEIFSQLGISAFEIRKKGNQPARADGLEALKRDFPDYPIEIK